MEWVACKSDWPMAEHSRFVFSKPHRWHVQEAGRGPLLLLLHGAGGATQSWRHLFPLLIQSNRVICIDLPGQGFTKMGSNRRCGLDEMAEDVLALCHDQSWVPDMIVGHSAGAAIGLRMVEMMQSNLPRIVGINAALGNFDGLAGVVFPIIAKTLAMVPFVADIFTASTTRPKSVERLIEGTGSHLSIEDLRWYRTLVGSRDHVNGTLQMMAQWRLDDLLKRLPENTANTILIAATGDKAVPHTTSKACAEKMPNGRYHALHGLGHLVHEEDAPTISDLIHSFLESELETREMGHLSNSVLSETDRQGTTKQGDL
jgi:magnesium chelatase accessory protein